MPPIAIELAPHQIVAVDRAQAILDARGGVILADDVGLGKSFVAAAIAVKAAAVVEFIVPAGLIAQWKSTLDLFALTAPITSHDRMVSEPFAPGPGADRLIIVDEAHAFRNPATQRYDALARRSIGARLLLVTATPICNAPDDLHALIALIAADDALRAAGVASIDDAFRERRRTEIAVVMRELVIRRGREVLDIQLGGLSRRVLRHPVPEVSIGALEFPLIGGERSLLHAFLWRRLESSEAAFAESLQRQSRFYERALQCIASGRTLTKRDYREAFGDEDADAFQEVLFWEVFASDDARGDAEAIREELARMDRIRSQIAEADSGAMQKLGMLIDLCAAVDEPMLIFTSAIATANAIFAAAKSVRRCGVVTSRAAIPLNAIDAFIRGALDVLICTDLAAEGLNLQRAGIVVHYDLPWNPVKIDQRNGRALRIGQVRDTVAAIYFLPIGRRTRVIRTIARKNRQRRRLLSGGAPPSAAKSLGVLPAHLPRSSPAVTLMHSLRRAGLDPPRDLMRRYRVGLERLFGEMASEYLDERRVSDLTSLLERERIIGAGAPFGSADR